MSGTDRIETQLKTMLVERLFLKVSPEEIGDEDPLAEKYGIDSVQLFEIVVGTEEVFGITFEDTEFSLEAFRDVASIAEIVRGKLRQRES